MGIEGKSDSIVIIVISALGGTLPHLSFATPIALSDQAVHQNVASTRTFVIDGEVKIAGTVADNITEYAAVDGPAYLSIRTDDVAQIGVTYSAGEAELGRQNAEIRAQ